MMIDQRPERGPKRKSIRKEKELTYAFIFVKEGEKRFQLE